MDWAARRMSCGNWGGQILEERCTPGGDLFGAVALGILSSFVASEPVEAGPQCSARNVSLRYCRRHSPGLDETTVNLQNLSTWLSWVETWASEAGERSEVEELHERLPSHLQHYTELSPAIVGTTTYTVVGPLLPLGSGTSAPREFLSLWFAKTDRMDSSAEDVGVKGGHWGERTDRAQHALRTVYLGYGAALFYIDPTRSTTYALLKSYLLPRLYTVPPPPNPSTASPNTVTTPAMVGSTKFPFNCQADVLDRDAVMIPSGWVS
ncbi:hypothetical protein L198_07352 [Cryptococcus wingfieldii CBS 7118]|uniref:Uncharacterized protein n=1 Tax=Cryptococcus wingfieldii CBS 7118 TaxID=1295528 RepID=A0A1E3ICJ2_9TREE|nr:hypothetical protein L198_07352 [Cryptococcus wingfieldii CBS 7118]ODN86333.1 hypothetical protein L198_07352 [Cryptococcus wingfieldii CBS 7118]